MASYTYDETGHMALFFIITVLFMVLVPFTLSQISFTPSTYKGSRMPLTLITVARHPGREIPPIACECSACVAKRTRILKREKGAFFRPSTTKKFVTPSSSY